MLGWTWIRRIEGLVRLRPNWQQLWLEALDATPFQLPALLSYIESFPSGDLLAAARFDGSSLVGLLVSEISGPSEDRTYRFSAEDRSDYLDALLAPERTPEMLTELASCLESLPQSGARVDLAQLPCNSKLLGLCELSKGWQWQPSVVCPEIALSKTYAN